LSRARRSEPEQGVHEVLGRFGFFARGVVYLFIGGIAARVALLARGRAEGPAGALRRLTLMEGGPALFLVAAIGLLAYGLSMLVLAAHRRRRLR
jgi:hypothetical protein